jgi:hypothetical protein
MKILTQTNYDIFDKFKEISIPLNGIYNKDDFPKSFKNGNYVINLDSKEGNGTHWTILKIYPHMILYFDSFGQGMPETLKKRFNNKNIYYNDKICQEINASSCAYWTIAFCCWMDRIKMKKLNILDHFQEFIDLFDENNQYKNEKILEDFLKPF